jgi:hypothetical protein
MVVKTDTMKYPTADLNAWRNVGGDEGASISSFLDAADDLNQISQGI